jgi:hypothetical protein
MPGCAALTQPANDFNVLSPLNTTEKTPITDRRHYAV